MQVGGRLAGRRTPVPGNRGAYHRGVTPVLRRPSWLPSVGLGGSPLVGALISVAFYIGAGLVMTLTDGFLPLSSPGQNAWVVVAVAWLATVIWLFAHRNKRRTAFGMIGFVVVFFGIFWLIGTIGSLFMG